MTRTQWPPHRRPTPAVRTRLAPILAAVAGLLVAAFAPAQTLPDLLPEDVVVAFGVHDLEGERERLQPFLDEAERLGLFESVAGAVPEEEADADVPAALEGLDPMSLLGDEALVALSASPFRPIPAGTFIARADDEAMSAFRTVIEDASADPGVERLEEGGRELWTYVPPADGADDDGLGMPIAYAQADEGVLIASTDPEIVRFALRALDGSGDPSMADGELYAALRDLGDGSAYFLADLLPVTEALEPFAAGFDAGPLLARVQDALATSGPTVGLVRATADGVEARSRLLPDPDGPDPALYELLTQGTTAAPSEALAFAPADAVTVGASTVDAAGWWSWLDDVLASAESLGVPSATEITMMFGLDVRTTLLDWMGDDVVQIVPAPAEAIEPGMPQEGLGATQAVLVESTDDAAARQGLTMLLTTIGPSLGAFTSPDGGAMAMPESVQVAGYDVQRLELFDELSIDTAVVDGWALITFSPEVTDAVLSAHAAGEAPPAALADAADAVPAEVRAWTVSDDRAAVLGTSDVLVTQLQTLAGLGGAGELDFDAVDEASADLAAWLEFLGERLGTSRGFTQVRDGALETETFTDVDW